ncbi:hypothetical protein [Pseudoxanthobacter sp.]|uniref:hypothetical protein n=1 Tax=Pseudoxanthobacter sp. TaxID=1925742 RepID=UPI002FE1A3AB
MNAPAGTPSPASAPSLAIRLFGTDEPVTPPRRLVAGRLTAELDGGNLRHIRYGGIEIIRAVSFIVRDRNWGTYNPQISDFALEETERGFRIAYDAVAADSEQRLACRATIEASADGWLRFSGAARAETDFCTNRTGFVVLHALENVAGHPVTIEHTDGRVVEGTFPALIDPVQPMMDLRALTHAPAPGLKVTCRMEGDAFEMEDQRNWTDASFKTYVRPLARPWPYTIAAGERLAQTVTLQVTGSAPAAAAAGPARIATGAAEGTVPRLGLGLDPDDCAATQAHSAALAGVGAGIVTCHYDPRRGHDGETLRQLAETARGLGAEPWLEAVIASVGDYAAEIAALGRTVAALGSPFATVLVSPAADLKCTLPGSPWPPAPPPAAFFAAARAAFAPARPGGGMFSYFTELNRKRPPAEAPDLVSYTTTATLHAGDDHSILEGLESLPAMAASTRAIAGGRPFSVGPGAIGMRANPYGAAPMPNPHNIRQAMNRNDPRHRGLLGAAWALGFFARFAAGGAESVVLGGATGPFGLLHTPQDWPQPWFDEAGGGFFPMFHVLKGLAALQGAPRLAVSVPDFIEAIAAEAGGRRVLWLANRRGSPAQVAIEGPVADVAVLDDAAFAAAARDAGAIETLTQPRSHGTLALGPYAIARVRFS